MEDDPNPNISILGMEKMLYAAKVSQSAVQLCADTWTNKIPMKKENFWEIRRTLKKLQKKLGELDTAITSFPIDFSAESDNERIKYLDSLTMITEKYLCKINKYESGHRIVSDIDNYTYFVELHSLLDGINDLSVGIKKTIDVLSLDKEDGIENAEDVVLWADEYLSGCKELPDKNPFNIAVLAWSYFDISHPIARREDGSFVLQKLLVGHPTSWGMMSNKRDTLIAYVKAIHKRFSKSDSLDEIDGTPHNWYDALCGPRMRHLIYASDVLLAKLSRKSEEKTPYYIS